MYVKEQPCEMLTINTHSRSETLWAYSTYSGRQVEKALVSAVQVKKETRTNPELSTVMDIIIKGQPAGDKSKLKPFLGRRLELSVQSVCSWGGG